MAQEVLVRVEGGTHDFPYLLPRVPCVGEHINLYPSARALHRCEANDFVVVSVLFTLKNEEGDSRGADPARGFGDALVVIRPLPSKQA